MVAEEEIVIMEALAVTNHRHSHRWECVLTNVLAKSKNALWKKRPTDGQPLTYRFPLSLPHQLSIPHLHFLRLPACSLYCPLLLSPLLLPPAPPLPLPLPNGESTEGSGGSGGGKKGNLRMPGQEEKTWWRGGDLMIFRFFMFFMFFRFFRFF